MHGYEEGGESVSKGDEKRADHRDPRDTIISENWLDWSIRLVIPKFTTERGTRAKIARASALSKEYLSSEILDQSEDREFMFSLGLAQITHVLRNLKYLKQWSRTHWGAIARSSRVVSLLIYVFIELKSYFWNLLRELEHRKVENVSTTNLKPGKTSESDSEHSDYFLLASHNVFNGKSTHATV